MTEQERPAWRRAIGPLAVAAALLVLWAVLQFEWVNWTSLGNWVRSQTPRIAVLGGAAVFALVGGIAWWRAPKRSAWAPGLSWWVVVAGAVTVAVVAWGATDWLLGEADGAVDRGAARVNAIKTSLGIGAGATGVFALLLAVRRQTHQERTAADTSFDAAEKRVTELYIKAVEQIGSDHAAVRLGGLYALERLAQGNKEHRQTVVNVLCAYLRMRYDIPGDPPEATADKDTRADYREQVQEREVRLTVQSILLGHFQPHANGTYWESINVDLSGALLINFNLSRCVVQSARFQETTFTGSAWFDRVTFRDAAWFQKANFVGMAQFSYAKFLGGAVFEGAVFGGMAQFGDVNFDRVARFKGVTFTGDGLFVMACFPDLFSFDGATAKGHAYMPAQLRPSPSDPDPTGNGEPLNPGASQP
jgi:hypothetical protein